MGSLIAQLYVNHWTPLTHFRNSSEHFEYIFFQCQIYNLLVLIFSWRHFSTLLVETATKPDGHFSRTTWTRVFLSATILGIPLAWVTACLFWIPFLYLSPFLHFTETKKKGALKVITLRYEKKRKIWKSEKRSPPSLIPDW